MYILRIINTETNTDTAREREQDLQMVDCQEFWANWMLLAELEWADPHPENS